MKKSTADTLRRVFWEWMPWIVMGPGLVMGVIDTVRIYRGQSNLAIIGLFAIMFGIFYLGTALGLKRAGGSISLMSNIEENEDVTVESYFEDQSSRTSYSLSMLVRRQNGDVRYFYAMPSDFGGMLPKSGWTYRRVGTNMVDIKRI